jgi:hypothetical protein
MTVGFKAVVEIGHERQIEIEVVRDRFGLYQFKGGSGMEILTDIEEVKEKLASLQITNTLNFTKFIA